MDMNHELSCYEVASFVHVKYKLFMLIRKVCHNLETAVPFRDSTVNNDVMFSCLDNKRKKEIPLSLSTRVCSVM